MPHFMSHALYKKENQRDIDRQTEEPSRTDTERTDSSRTDRPREGTMAEAVQLTMVERYTLTWSVCTEQGSAAKASTVQA